MADVSGRQDADSSDHPEKAAVIRREGHLPRGWVTDRTASLSLSRSVYSLKAVLAAAYKFSDRFAVLVDTDGDERWTVFLIGPDGVSVDSILTAFTTELGDQQLRCLLESEFGPLRTLIVAQAFSEGNLLDPGRETEDDKADVRGTGLRR